VSPRLLFVAGAHTEIGKTYVACGLLRAARARGWSAEALKPVVSGFDEADWADSDPGRLLAALNVSRDAAALARISPWRFAAPLAPPMAARAEGRALPPEPIIAFCRERIARSRADFVVVEGVGGLMSPIAEVATTLDLLQALGAPSVLVGGGYLGAISHTLTSLEVLRGRRAPPAAVIVSQGDDPVAPDFAATVALVAEHAGSTPVIAAARGDLSWAEPALKAAFG
jgi:dethiobiotin synthetase